MRNRLNCDRDEGKPSSIKDLPAGDASPSFARDRHPELMPASAAIVYLGLDVACPTREAARAVLRKLDLHPIKSWAREFIYVKSDLDAMAAEAIAEALTR